MQLPGDAKHRLQGRIAAFFRFDENTLGNAKLTRHRNARAALLEALPDGARGPAIAEDQGLSGPVDRGSLQDRDEGFSLFGGRMKQHAGNAIQFIRCAYSVAGAKGIGNPAGNSIRNRRHRTYFVGLRWKLPDQTRVDRASTYYSVFKPGSQCPRYPLPEGP